MLGLLKHKPVEEELDYGSSEKVPTFLVNDGKIVDVYYTEFLWDEENKYTVQPTSFGIKECGDRIIFETSRGCLEFSADLWPGDTVVLHHGGGGSPLRPCTRKAGF